MSELDTTAATRPDTVPPPRVPDAPEPVGEPQEPPREAESPSGTDAKSAETTRGGSADRDSGDAEPEEPSAPRERFDSRDSRDLAEEPEQPEEPEEPEGLEEPEGREDPEELGDPEEPEEPEEPEGLAEPEEPELQDALEEDDEPEAPEGSVDADDADDPEDADDPADAEGTADPEDGDDTADAEGADDPADSDNADDPDDELPELELELAPYRDSVPYSTTYTASLGAGETGKAAAPDLPREEGQAEAPEQEEAPDSEQEEAPDSEREEAPDSEPEELDHGAEAEVRSPARDFSSNEEGAEYGRTEWADAQSRLTDEQREAFYGYSLEKYPGDEGPPDYKEINGFLRGYAPGSAEVDNSIQRLDEGMEIHPVPEDLTVMRETGLDSFNCPIEEIEGSVQSDRGYLSTALGSDPDFDTSKEVVLHLRVPEGTPAMYLEGVSEYGSERELLLGRGVEYLVTELDYNEDDDRYHVHGEIIR
ncbi:ADP-ribosyltransferase [Streptomyces sp. NPDC047981]|uniref:ADP-ribosyltransferase n=1 Tax=Streptomyces sp. NPDC047981 TaxID=3154610 RepID=UPI003426A535